MSERLDDLRRQRALAQEQLAWFDREIARESGQSVPISAPAPAAPIAPAPAPIVTDHAARDAAISRTADDIISRYEKPPGNAALDAKKGCYAWFAFAMLTVVLTALGIYLVYRD